MKKIALTIAVVAMSLLFGGVAIAQQQVNPIIEKRLQEMVDQKFANTILMTEKDCKSFGEGWQAYGRIGGRFPLGEGIGKDARSEAMEFRLGNEGGEYRHVLSVPEMPKHRHGYVDRAYGGQPQKVDHGDDRAHELQRPKRQTEVSGGDKPHNNMPPYLVLRFCHKP